MVLNDWLIKCNYGCDSGLVCLWVNCVFVNNKFVLFCVFLGILFLFVKSELFKCFYDYFVECSWICEILIFVNFVIKKI